MASRSSSMARGRNDSDRESIQSGDSFEDAVSVAGNNSTSLAPTSSTTRSLTSRPSSRHRPLARTASPAPSATSTTTPALAPASRQPSPQTSTSKASTAATSTSRPTSSSSRPVSANPTKAAPSESSSEEDESSSSGEEEDDESDSEEESSDEADSPSLRHASPSASVSAPRPSGHFDHELAHAMENMDAVDLGDDAAAPTEKPTGSSSSAAAAAAAAPSTTSAPPARTSALATLASTFTKSDASASPSTVTTPTAATAPAREPKSLSLSGFSLPSMPWSTPSSAANTPSTTTAMTGNPVEADVKSPISEVPTPPPASGVPPSQAPASTPMRKLTSPFSWLSRNKDKDKEKETTPPATRRNTASSVGTLVSNPEMMLSRLDEEGKPILARSRGHRRNSTRDSLRDRFKTLRMREEAGIVLAPEDYEPVTTDKEKSTESTESTTATTTTTTTTGDSPSQASPPKLKSSLSSSSTASQPPPPTSPTGGSQSLNLNLAPGTASGVSAGPSSIADAEVDWDLWQNVVYEGPAAVARSSAEELNRAIMTGIPSPIRGVIWQVLANSKDEDLEALYHELVARGTDKEREKAAETDRKEEEEKDAAATAAAAAASTPTGETASASSSNPCTDTPSTEKADASDVSVSDAEAALSPAVSEPPTLSDRSLSARSLSVQGDTATAASSAPPSEIPSRSASPHPETEELKRRKKKEEAARLAKLEKTIRKDLGMRTSFSKFAAAQGLQEALFGVCKAYALYDEGVGYAQGLNFLIMPMLFHMPEEEAFSLLVRLMQHYHLREMFTPGMTGLHLRLYQFERILEDLEPALYCHLHRRDISPHLYATQWFLTLFAYRFPLQLVLRIYDLILSDGLVAILRFGIVLMQRNATTLLGLRDMQQLTAYLKDKLFDVYIDKNPSSGRILENGFFGSSSSSMDREIYRADEFVRDACSVKITPEMLKQYTAEWEVQTKNQREREAELDHLRQTNQGLATRLRGLEERMEVSDAEQATLATELVRLKVANEELRDENEGLHAQARELRIFIDKQPQELEREWHEKLEALRDEHTASQSEKERLQAELTDLEVLLVQTKVQYAELNEKYEVLSRRWTDLKKQFV